MNARRKRPIDAGQFDVHMKALELRGIDGLGLGEISEQLGVSVTTLRRWLKDVPRRKLR